MIIIFETKTGPKLENYLKNFENPPITSVGSLLTAFASNTFHKRVYRVDDLVLISMKGFWEKYFVYAIYFVVIELILSALFGWDSLLKIMFFVLIFLFSMVSADFRGWMIALKLKLGGHKGKISFPNKEYVVDKLLFRVFDESK
jgi:hypothetical protein